MGEQIYTKMCPDIWIAKIGEKGEGGFGIIHVEELPLALQTCPLALQAPP